MLPIVDHSDLDKIVDGKKSLRRKPSKRDFSLLEEEESFLEHLSKSRDRHSYIFKSFTRGYAREFDETRSIELIRIRNFVTNLLRIHGLSIKFEVLFKSCVETASSSYSSEGKSFVLLGLAPFRAKSVAADKVYEIYGGFGLHESQHLISSKEFFLFFNSSAFKRDLISKDLEVSEKANVTKLIYNLLEDCRIEHIILEDSPGFDQYVIATRDFVFRDSLEQFEKHFSSMSSRSKFLFLLTTTLRYPVILTLKYKTMEIEGFCPYKIISKIPSRLDSFDDVKQLGDALVEVFLSLNGGEEREKMLSELKDKLGLSSESSEKGDSHGEEMGESCADSEETSVGTSGKTESKEKGKSKAKDKDKAVTEGGESSEDESDEDESETSGSEAEDEEEGASSEPSEPSDASEEGVTPEPSDVDKAIDKLKKGAEKSRDLDALTRKHGFEAVLIEREIPFREALGAVKVSRTMDKVKKSMDHALVDAKEVTKSLKIEDFTKFGLKELDTLLSVLEMKDESLTPEEYLDVTKKIDEKLESHKDFLSGDSLLAGRDLTVIEPIPSPEDLERYERAKTLVFPFTRKASDIFQFRLNERRKRVVDLTEGRLLRKRLPYATVTDKLFFQEHKYKSSGISICILLDESGSMGCAVVPPKLSLDMGAATEAFLMAVMLKEALSKVPKIDFHCYSHASFGHHSENVFIKHLYGGSRIGNGISCYLHGGENYDHAAIKFVGDRFKNQSRFKKNRIFFYLADGCPCGRSYGGPPAIAAVKKVVSNFEKEGMSMICLGVSGHSPVTMFKNSVAFEGDFNSLLVKVRDVLATEILSVGMEKI